MTIKGSLYLHQKTGNTYEAVDRCLLEASAKTMMVVYRDYPRGDTTWVRPESEFFDGRFKYLGVVPDRVFDPLRDIMQFHENFGLQGNRVPGALPEDVARFRYKFLREELREWLLAQATCYDETTKPITARNQFEYEEDLAKALDGLVDLAYVLFGTVYLHGFGKIFEQAWTRVHTANMQKVRADLDGSNSKRGSSLDVVKPAGWEPPHLTDLVIDFHDLYDDHSDRA